MLSDKEWVEWRRGSTFLVNTDIDGVSDKARARSGDDGQQYDDVQAALAELSPSGPQDGDNEHKNLQDNDNEDSTDSLQGNNNEHSPSLQPAKHCHSGSLVIVSQSHSTGSPTCNGGNGLQEDDTEDDDEDDNR